MTRQEVAALQVDLERAELAAAEAQREIADERQGRALDAEAAQRRLDQAAASLGAKVAEVAKLERELAIARAAIPETVICSGCDLVVLVSSLHWGTRATHYGRHGEPCGSWTKGGKRWLLPCEHPADDVERQMEEGE